MMLHVYSDTLYLSISKAQRKVESYHYLSSPSNNPNLPPTETPPMNGPIHAVCNILLYVMASSAEA